MWFYQRTKTYKGRHNGICIQYAYMCVCVWVSPHLRRLVSSVITLYINIIAASQVLKTRELRFKDDQR